MAFTQQRTPFTQDDLIRALRDCFDPGFKCNIVDLGEVLSAALTEDTDAPGTNVAPRFHAAITLALPTRDEAAEAQLIAQIANRLAGIWEISATTITVSNDITWTPDRITPEGRTILGLDKLPRGPQLIQIKL